MNKEIKLRYATQAWAWDNYEGWHIAAFRQLQYWDGTEWQFVPDVKNDVGPMPEGPPMRPKEGGE